MPEIVIVTATFDAAHHHWTATSREMAALCVTRDTWADLIDGLPDAVEQRLARRPACRRGEVAIEVVAHVSLSVTMSPRRARAGKR